MPHGGLKLGICLENLHLELSPNVFLEHPGMGPEVWIPSLHWLEADAAPRFPIHHQIYQNGRITMELNHQHREKEKEFSNGTIALVFACENLHKHRARAIEEARELEAALYAKRQEIAKYEEEIAEYRTLKALLPV
ncbi:hypothetical protein RRG08_018945 [Elysia crispata]|nr:hypothetical protein RRG08_018942 [Elysia crispata]KAK3781318.1 hypothetical protein RRG08_018945 [Elysia crispata]